MSRPRIARQAEEIERLKKLQEKTLKEKVRKDHKIGALQKKLKGKDEEIETLKKTRETYEADYYGLEDRMKLLRKRNSFLEVNLGKANKISDDAKKTVEMKEQECKLMATIIHNSRAASTSNATSFSPQFSVPAADSRRTTGDVVGTATAEVQPNRRPGTAPCVVSPVNLFGGRAPRADRAIEDELKSGCVPIGFAGHGRSLSIGCNSVMPLPCGKVPTKNQPSKHVPAQAFAPSRIVIGFTSCRISGRSSNNWWSRDPRAAAQHYTSSFGRDDGTVAGNEP